MTVRGAWVAIALSLAACGGARPPAPAPSPAAAAGIEWQPWSRDAFEQAERDGRLVLVDVGIEGCTACRWMYEDTYQDAQVVARVREHFVAIQVDADQRPDLGERYSAWGWPATIFLTPGGTQVLAVRGNKRPRSFLPILDALIERHQNGTLDAADADALVARAEAEPTDVGRVCARALARIDALQDTEHGGWGRGPQHVDGVPVQYAIFRAHNRDEPARLAHALQTLSGFARLIDPVWGGVFVAARGRRFERPIPEKRTVHEAQAMLAFLEGYGHRGDAQWLTAARDIERYLREQMRAPDGTFYSTQEDDAPGLPRGMSAAEYYRLADGERRRYGMPPIDHGVYTDQNGMVIEAYVRLFEATGDADALNAAIRAARQILSTRQRLGGWLLQAAPSQAVDADTRMRSADSPERMYLRAQGPFGSALLALHGVTGERRWLDAAGRIAAAMRRELEVPGGGFFATTETETDGLVPRRLPFYENVAAARFLFTLFGYTKDGSLRDAAERTVLAMGAAAEIARHGPRVAALARVADGLLQGAVEVSVLRSDDDIAAVALFDAARRVYEPRKVVHYEAPGRYPDQGRPALFACTDYVCSSPVFEPGEVAAVVARLAAVRQPDPCVGGVARP